MILLPAWTKSEKYDSLPRSGEVRGRIQESGFRIQLPSPARAGEG